MCFWHTKTWRNFNFSRCIHVLDLVIKCRSDKNERFEIKLLFYFTVLVNIVASLTGMSFFRLSVSFLVEVFSNCNVTETFAIVGICLVSSTSYLHGLKFPRVAQMCFSSDDIMTFWSLAYRIFSFVFWMCLHVLAIGFSNIVWWALTKRCNCSSFVWSSPIVACFQLVTVIFGHICLTCKIGRLYT